MAEPIAANPDACNALCMLPGKDGQELEFFALGAPNDTILYVREPVFGIVSQSMRRVEFDFSVSRTSIYTFPGHTRADCGTKPVT